MLSLKYQSDCAYLTYISTPFLAQRAASATRTGSACGQGRGCRDAAPRTAALATTTSPKQTWFRGWQHLLVSSLPSPKQQLCPSQTQPNLAQTSQSRCSGTKPQDALQDKRTPSTRSSICAAGATAGSAFYFIQTGGLVPRSRFRAYLL